MSAAAEALGSLDRPIAVTFFRDAFATTKQEAPLTPRVLAQRIRETWRAKKDALPWLKLARFGEVKTVKGSLRHDANVLAISGCEGDYDAEQMPMAEAVELLSKQGIASIVYTSPSATAERHRWRALCPFSRELPPSKREHMLGRLNGLLGGVFSVESFTLSQSYYFGGIAGNEAHHVELTDGTPIDLHDDLDETWIGKPATEAGTSSSMQSGSLNVAALLKEIVEGANYHGAAIRLAGHWSTQGVPYVEVRKRLCEAMEAVPKSERDDRWRKRFDDIDRVLSYVFGKRVEEEEEPRRGRAKGEDMAPEADAETLANPDLSVLRLHRRPPPKLPLEVFGPAWGRWIDGAARAAACPADYVAAPLLAAAAATIGHARWGEASPGWAEPPHLWCASVGDSGNGKSPGGDAVLGQVLPQIERRMLGDFPDRLAQYKAAAELAEAEKAAWKEGVKKARKAGNPPPMPPDEVGSAPMAPQLILDDVSIERVALTLARAAPKGLLMRRDELAGWLLGMNAYNDGARAIWLQSYGGRPYRVDRMKLPEPVDIPRFAVAWWGGIQPGRLTKLMAEPDDGLLARFIWFWPDPVPFAMGAKAPDIGFATASFDRLRMLEMRPAEKEGGPPEPAMVPLADATREHMVAFAREMQERQEAAGGLMRSAYGKARGLVLRLSLVLTHLWWAAEPGMAPPPAEISERAFFAAATLVSDYLMPMAERVYGDAACPAKDRRAATLARWIARERPAEVHVRHMVRDVRLPDLTEADAVHEAAEALVEAGWLLPMPGRPHGITRARAAYPINPRLYEALDAEAH